MNKLSKPLHYSILFLVLAVIVGGLLVTVNAITAPIIAQNELNKMLPLLEVLDPDADLFVEATSEMDDLPVQVKKVFYGKSNNTNRSIIYWTVTTGYNAGEIYVLTAILLSNDEIISTMVTKAAEQTAGIGDAIVTHDFKTAGKDVSIYANLDINGLLRDDFATYEIISGATISSKAFLNGVRMACNHYVESVR